MQWIGLINEVCVIDSHLIKIINYALVYYYYYL